MTITNTTIKSSASGDGSTSSFTYTFPINSTSELSVIIKASTGAETVKDITTHYTVADAGATGGTVTFTSGNIPASGETVVLFRNTTKNQTVDLIENDPFLAEGLENQFDNLQMQIQEVSEAVDRSFKVSKTNAITTSSITTSAADRANKILAFDASGNLDATANNNLDTLTEMTDVTLSSPADNEVLAYDSSSTHFINQTPAEAGLVSLTGSETLTNKTLTSPVLNTGVSGTAVLDEDNMASDSATQLATQQSIKAYVDAVTTSLNAQDLDVSDGSSAIGIDLDTETLGILGGTGLASSASGNNVTLSVDAAQTGITSVTNASLVLGRDADNDIDFTTDNQITFRVSANDGVVFKASGEIEATSLDISGDADIDGTLEADAITVGGTALNTVIAGVTVTNATNAVNSTHVSVADNENTNEENLITFIEDASATGNVGLESDGDFAYNPSTGTVSATIFKGNIDAVDGDFDGTLEADSITVGGTNLTAIYSPIAGGSNIVTTGALNSGSITSGFGSIDNGSSAITTTGVITGGTVEATADTSAGDNAAIGYTAAEGLILTGQGSTSDITLKNDADAVVFTVPTGTDDILFPDDAKAMFGASSDLVIYHHNNGSSYIQETGGGDLQLLATNFKVMNAAGTENKIAATTDGAVDLYYDNAKKFETTSTGIDVTGAIVTDAGGTIGAAGTTTTLAGIAVASENNSIFMSDSDIMDTTNTAAFDTVYGWGAGKALTTGDSNTFMGYLAGAAVTTGSANIMIGESTGDGFDTEGNNLGIGNGALGGSIAGGEYNVSIGNTSLDALTSGDNNVALGYNAGSAATTAAGNVLIGAYVAQTGVFTGNNNVVIGKLAGNDMTSADANVIIGEDAGANLTTANNSILIGQGAGEAITTGADNIFIGQAAGDGHDAETNNLGIGKASMGASINGGEYNVAIGNLALDGLTSADNCTAVGYNAMSAAVTGNDNTAIGYQAGNGITGGVNNTIVGKNSGVSITTAQNCTLVGKDAGLNNTAHECTAFGSEAALGNTSGAGITALGREAYKQADTEGHNLAIGAQAMAGAVNGGEYNVAVGNFSLDALTSGDSNVAIGYNAGSAMTTGSENILIGLNAVANGVMTSSYNTIIGAGAGLNKTSGGSNVFLGYQSGEQCTTTARTIFIGSTAGDDHDTENDNLGIGTGALGGAIAGGEYNVGIGNASLVSLTSGDKNTSVGYSALEDMTEGNNNTAIGHKAGYQTTTGTHNTYLGESSGGNVTSGGENIFVGRSAGTDSVYNATNESNRLVLGINAITDAYIKVAFTVTSDARDKMNFEDVPHGLSFVNQLNPVKFHFKKSRDDETPHGNARYGFKAQDILALEGENNVIIDNENTENLKYKGEHLVPVLVKAVQELSAQVTTLQQEINTLKGE